MEVPPDTLMMGSPAKPRRAVSPEERVRFREGNEHYVTGGAVMKEASKGEAE